MYPGVNKKLHPNDNARRIERTGETLRQGETVSEHRILGGNPSPLRRERGSGARPQRVQRLPRIRGPLESTAGSATQTDARKRRTVEPC